MTSFNPLAKDLDGILAGNRPYWRELKNKKIFITGGTGFIGCWLLESFLWANQKLKLNASATVLTRDANSFRRRAPHLAGQRNIHLLQGDIRGFRFPGGNFSHIIHAAADTGIFQNENKPLSSLEYLFDGSKRVLDFSKRNKNAKFLLLSSGAVYGAQPAGLSRLLEDFTGAPDPLSAHSAYAEGKRLAELLCALYHKEYGLQTKIARCFTFVGPYMNLNGHHAAGNFIRDGLTGGSIEVKGDGKTVRSYFYAADLASWLWTILFKGKVCRPYNVGSDKEVTIRQLAEKVSDAFDSKPKIRINHRGFVGMGGNRYVPSVARARKELGLKQKFNIQESIQKTVDWYKR